MIFSNNNFHENWLSNIKYLWIRKEKPNIFIRSKELSFFQNVVSWQIEIAFGLLLDNVVP